MSNLKSTKSTKNQKHQTPHLLFHWKININHLLFIMKIELKDHENHDSIINML